jgi:hypothetical protein
LKQFSIDQGLNYGGDRDAHGVAYGIDVLLIVILFLLGCRWCQTSIKGAK